MSLNCRCRREVRRFAIKRQRVLFGVAVIASWLIFMLILKGSFENGKTRDMIFALAMVAIGYDVVGCLANTIYYKVTKGKGVLIHTIEELKVWKVKSPVYYL